MNKPSKPAAPRPFFSRFLDNQRLEDVTGGRPTPPTTDKFPSDNDETVADET
jgi:hypothetical protein